MRSVGFVALDREKIGTKLYGYVLAKRYTILRSSPLFKIPHGGLGIGGVLFGSLEAGRAPNQA